MLAFTTLSQPLKTRNDQANLAFSETIHTVLGDLTTVPEEARDSAFTAVVVGRVIGMKEAIRADTATGAASLTEESAEEATAAELEGTVEVVAMVEVVLVAAVEGTGVQAGAKFRLG